MTPHERFLAWMRYEPVDRPPLWEWGPWPSTLRRWQREALGEGARPPQYERCEGKLHCGVDLWMLPRFEREVLAEDEESITERTDRGQVMRRLKNPDAMSMPHHIEYPVKTRRDWEELRERFDPDEPGRFPEDWHESCKRWETEGPVLVLQGPRSPSLFGFVRELMGPERALYAFHDEPDLVHEMMETSTRLVLGLLPRVAREAPLTSVFFWEDMCYRGGPLISPAMFREFMVGRYRRVTERAAELGVEVCFVDSDGNVEELLPLWMEAGIRGNYPLEVAAGMDVRALRKEHGRNLLMTGGIDKRALAAGQEQIDRELERTVPVAAKGGYIPHIDHAIPHDVPYENFAYYFERKAEILAEL